MGRRRRWTTPGAGSAPVNTGRTLAWCRSWWCRRLGTVVAMTTTEHGHQRSLRLSAPSQDPDAPPEPLPEQADPPSEILSDALWQGGAPVDFAWVTSTGVDVVADLGDADV